MTNKFISFLSLSLENGSRMTRDCIGIDTVKSRKLFTLLFVLFLGFGQMWGAEVSFAPSDFTGQGTSGSGSAMSATKSGVTVSISKGYGTTEIRAYQNSSFTISSSNTITALSFTFSGGKTGGLNTSYTNLSTTSWSQNSLSSQARFSNITVTYTPSASSYTLSSAVSPAESGSVSLSATSLTQGSTATATATPAAHYTFTNWSISGTGATLNSTKMNPATVTMGTANATVTANFTAVPKASITLSEAGATTTDDTNYYVGDTYTLPTSTSASCGSKVLAGWSTVTVSETDTKPSSKFYEKGEEVTLGATQTFYAVFAIESSTPESWDPVTSEPSDWSGEYVIVNTDKTYAMTSDFYSGTSGEFKGATVTITDNKVVSPTNKMIWTVAKNGNNAQYSFKNKSTGTYANITGTNSSNAALSTSAVWFTIASSSTTGVWKVNSVTYNARCFSWYATNSSFRTYAKSLNNTGYLYKKSGGTTYSAYATTCCTKLGSVNGSVSLTNDGCGAGELKATWKTSSTGLDGIASQTVKVYRADNNNEVTGLTGLTGKTAQTTDQTVTISGLTPCVEYYVKIWNVSKDGSYCESDFAGDKSSNVAAASYTITKTGVTNVTAESLSAIPATTCASGFNATIVAASGYDLPGTITVTGANHTWNQATGTLTISNVTGNVVITITPTEAQCTPLTAPSVSVSGKDYPYDAVTLSWTAVEHADGYTVEIYDGETKIEGDDLDGGADSYTIGTTLAANKTYTYKVKATSETPATYCPSEWATDDFTTADYPTATLTLSEVGGEDYNLSGSHKLNDVVKLPSTLTYAGCTGKVLVGWSSVAIETPGSKPASNYWDKGADYTLSSTSGKLYAVYATETPGSTSWDETALSSLGAGDVFVIVGNNGSNYAMTNDNGTSNPPAASSVTVSGTHLTGTIADNIKWNISGNTTNGYVFYPNGSTTTWLYCTADNNGVRIGTNANKTFKPTNASYLQHVGTSRYVGIYSSQDWRCYTSSGGNISGQTFKYYKLNVTATVNSNYTTACAAALANPTFDPAEDAEEEYLAAQNLTISGPTDATIYYTMTTDGNEPDDPTDESDEYSSVISMNSRATYWIKAFAKKDASESEIVEAKYNINLPFTVAEAIAEIPNEGDERDKTYIDGIVCTAATSISSGKMTYYISDDGSETSKIRIYSGKGLNNANFSATTDLKIGDKVRVYGKLNNYSGSYDVDNSYLKSLETATVSSIEIGGTATKTAYTAGDNTFSYAGLTATATYNTGYVKDVTSEATWKANDVTSYAVTETEDVSVTGTFGGQTSDAMVVGVTYTTKTVKSIYLEYESTYTYKGMALPKPKVYAKYVEEIADEEVTSLVEAASGYDTESTYNKDVVDTYTINVAYQSKEATYTVEVRAIFNDVDHPYTPSEATTIIVEAIGENQSSDYIYVAGKVSAIDGSIDNNTLKYFISYDGTTTGQLYVYKGKYINNANFTNSNILVVGDEVVVKAQAQNYQGETPELKSSQVLKHYRAPEFTFADIVAGDEFEYDYSIDLAVTPTKNTGNAEFTLESDDESIVSIVDGKLHAAGVGTTKITASREATNLANQMNYSAKTAEFNVTVIAKRTRYAITFDDGGATSGTAPEAIDDQLAGATVNLPASCSYSWPKHGFTGWAVTAGETPVEVTDGHFTMPEANVTITAQWAEIATTQIIFNVNGSTNVIAAVDVPQNEEYELTQTTDPINGYTFVGWAESEEEDDVETELTTIESYTPAVNEESKTLYAVFKRTENNPNKKYTLDYANEEALASSTSWGSYGTAYAYTASDGSAWTVKAYKNNGMQINTGKDCSIKIPDCPANIVSIKVTCGAKAVGLSASDYPGSGTITYIVYGTDATSQTLDFTGKSVKGGYLVPKGGSTVVTKIEVEYDGTKIYYTTAPAAVYDVEYALGGGAWKEDEGCDDTKVKAGHTYTICTDEPVRDGYNFVKWQIGGEDAASTITINANTTITAVWIAKPQNNLTYNAGTGTGSNVIVSNVEEGTVVTLKAIGSSEGQANFTKDGYNFVGWLRGDVLYKAGETFEMPAEAVTLTAQWKKQNVVKMSLITSIDQLVSGTTVVLASKDPVLNNVVKPSALAGDLGSNNYLASLTDNITFSGNEVSYTNANVLELVVEQVEGGWKLRKDATNYLKETNIKTLAWGTASEATTWTITFSNGNVNITSNLGSMKYNAQDPRFTTYASGQKDIQLYGKATVVNSSTSISEIGYVDGDVIVLNNDATLTVDANIAPSTVIVPSGSTVTVNDNKTVNANTVIVENGGTLDIDDEGTVKTAETLIIHSTLGKGTGTNTSGNAPGNCGQIANGNNITVNGDVYLELELTQEAAASAGWYAFSVPFPVDAMNGVYYGNTKLQNEVGYAIMSYHGDIRAQGQYAWKKYRDIMEPGVLYIIAVGDTDYKTLRFKKHGTDAFNVNPNVSVKSYPVAGDVPTTNRGWNGIGNPNMQISYLPETNKVAYMQFLIHEENRFQVRTRSNVNVVVGSAFFVQYSGNSDATIEITPGLQDGANGYLAPKRERNAIEETIYEVELTNVATEEVEDNIFLTAREEALNEYEVGRDLAKMSMGNAKCAQMWVPAYGTQLCAADFQLINDKAEYPLIINTPKAGTYSINAQENENATIYLTYNGRAIWNLSMSACELDLTQGLNEGYGLRLVVNAPEVVTGVDEVTGDGLQVTGAQKVIIDEHVYILRGGQMYDVNGKMVK